MDIHIVKYIPLCQCIINGKGKYQLHKNFSICFTVLSFVLQNIFVCIKIKNDEGSRSLVFFRSAIFYFKLKLSHEYYYIAFLSVIHFLLNIYIAKGCRYDIFTACTIVLTVFIYKAHDARHKRIKVGNLRWSGQVFLSFSVQLTQFSLRWL